MTIRDLIKYKISISSSDIWLETKYKNNYFIRFYKEIKYNHLSLSKLGDYKWTCEVSRYIIINNHKIPLFITTHGAGQKII